MESAVKYPSGVVTEDALRKSSIDTERFSTLFRSDGFRLPKFNSSVRRCSLRIRTVAGRSRSIFSFVAESIDGRSSSPSASRSRAATRLWSYRRESGSLLSSCSESLSWFRFFRLFLFPCFLDWDSVRDRFSASVIPFLSAQLRRLRAESGFLFFWSEKRASPPTSDASFCSPSTSPSPQRSSPLRGSPPRRCCLGFRFSVKATESASYRKAYSVGWMAETNYCQCEAGCIRTNGRRKSLKLSLWSSSLCCDSHELMFMFLCCSYVMKNLKMFSA